MAGVASEWGQQQRWQTPTGEPCPRTQRLDGTIEGSGDCVGCGFCLLLAGLVDVMTERLSVSARVLPRDVRGRGVHPE